MIEFVCDVIAGVILIGAILAYAYPWYRATE